MSNQLYSDTSLIAIPLKNCLEKGFAEDTGFGDITSSILPDQSVAGFFTAKEEGIISGIHAISTGYKLLDETVKINLLVQDGDAVQPGDRLAEAEGSVRTLLTGERVILNVLQHMSGIATTTAAAVRKLEGSKTRVCDTRKTLPGLRALQKYAVRCGGGFNHRLRLDDGVMIKDNHIAATGSISRAVELARKQIGLMVNIEVECENGKQVEEAVRAGADIIMLDNQTPESAAGLCKIIPDHITIELSGGITQNTIGKYKNCGADYISSGSITHSVKALDVSFTLSGAVKTKK